MLKNNFEYHNRNLITRFYQPEDFIRWQQLFSDMNLKQNQWDWEPESLEDLTKERFEEKLRKHDLERKEGTIYYFCVEEKVSKDLIGIAIINNIDKENSKAEIGFQISNKYWGKGYGTETAETLINIVRKYLKLREVYAEINPKNKVSLHILKALGFQNTRKMNNNRLIIEKCFVNKQE